MRFQMIVMMKTQLITHNS